MGWTVGDVRACSLVDFQRAVEAWNAAQSGQRGMTEDEAVELRREIWGENG